MEKGRLAGTLTRQNRPVEMFLAGHNFDGATINEALRWGNKVEAEARIFLLGRNESQPRRLKPRDAHFGLAKALAELAKGGVL